MPTSNNEFRYKVHDYGHFPRQNEYLIYGYLTRNELVIMEYFGFKFVLSKDGTNEGFPIIFVDDDLSDYEKEAATDFINRMTKQVLKHTTKKISEVIVRIVVSDEMKRRE